MTSPADEPGRYEYKFDPERENDTAAAIFKLAVEGGPRVLDIGCGRGIVPRDDDKGRELAARGLRVFAAAAANFPVHGPLCIDHWCTSV